MSHPPRVLVVEDEPTIADAITARLAAEGFDAQQVHDGLVALERAAAWDPEVVVLDIMLPGLDGLEVCRRLQGVRPVPVLMLTARDDETDLLVGLGIGADDYMTKPFSMRELVARLRVLLRRVERAAEAPSPAPTVAVDGLRIDGAQRRVWSRDEEVHLTPTEFDLLVCLAARPGTVLSREALLAEVWGWADASGTRTVDSHVKSLRRKLGAARVRTVHGVGYALEVGGVNYDLRPLDRARSIKTKLGLLVAVTITVASVLAVVGTRLGVSPWATVPVAVAAALVVTQLLARGMTSPLREMTVAAQRMAQGDYSQRVRATSGDEVGELARAFNRMSATLELVDRHRRDLVANVSHELRTPISALQAVLENLVDGVSEPGPEELRSALAQTERLGRLVGDLLDLSRVEEGVTPLRVSEVDVAELLDDAVAQARVDALRYSVVVSPPGLTVRADPDRLHQLLANLLDNAARHSPSDGEVRVAAARHGEQVHLDVADDGPGIAPAERGLVFERFTTSAAQNSGTGLGLAISRWVVQLHGGTIAVADSEHGCRIEVVLPSDPTRPTTTKEPVMSTLTPPAPSQPPPAAPARDTLASFWPDAPDRRPGLAAAAAAAGILAALVIPNHRLGLGTALVFAAVCGTVLAARGRRPGRGWTRSDLADAAVVVLLLATLVLRDAAWITMLCLLAALGLVAVGSTRATSVLGTIGSAVAVPLAGLRGLPWLGRTLRPRSSVQSWLPAVRATVLSAVLLLAFGALFASADALFASWVDAITPDITWNDLPARVVLAVFIAAGTLAAAYVGLTPPAVDRLQPRLSPSRRDFEWLAPIGVVNGVFALFLAAQATAMFGGHAYLQRTTGLTYADYVHEGFGQLTTATLLTLTVVAWASHKALPSRRRDLALGALCLMTVVVVVSALYRMHLYEEAYGFTRLRLLVSVFEGWLGVVLVMVLVAGVLGGRRWLVPLAIRAGALGLLGLALVNPDLYIAQHNIDRVGSAAGVDYAYLGSLSADALPAVVRLPDAEFSCATRGMAAPGRGDWLDWNVARERGATQLTDRSSSRAAAVTAVCPTTP